MRGLRFSILIAALACAALIVAAQAPADAANTSDSNEKDIRIRRTPIVTAVEKARGSVVNISTERAVTLFRGFNSFSGPGGDPFDDFFRQWYRAPAVERRKVETPLGSGCVISADGLVITNEHVVRRATNIKLSLADGETFDAVLLAADPSEDIALLRMKTDQPIKAIPMGGSSDLMLGETIVAMGNPYGFENSVTSGIISAFNREIRVGEIKYEGLIQTSALINPGNSGGPLINVLGELVGINTAVVDQAQGIGFAIPIDRARDILAPLLATPQVSEAWPGIRAATTEGRDGARVLQVEKKGPAGSALKEGDIICEIDGAKVSDLFDFLVRVVQHQPGDEVSLKIVRNGKTASVKFALGRMPVPSPKKILHDKFGITGQNNTPELAEQLKIAINYGVLVSEVWPDSPAEKVGLEKSDVIIQIGAHAVRNLREAAAALRSTRAGERVFVRIVRGKYNAYAWMTVPK